MGKILDDISRDPFGERRARPLHWRAHVLGARVEFSSNRRVLLELARQAFADVPARPWPGGAGAELRIDLQYVRDARTFGDAMPPKPALSCGAGLMCAHVDERNFVIMDPVARRALVQVGDALLNQPRLLRYELMEFAAITLATRSLGLVSLHAACVAARGRGVLLLGGSGAGKSTLSLHAALGGLDFIAEDAVFLQPTSLRASGLSAHAHARADGLRLIADRRVRAAVRRAPLIRRRSGVRKHEIDLRRGLARLAPVAPRIVAIVVLSERPARGAPLRRLTTSQLRRRLRAGQAFARTQPGWQNFETRVLRAGGYLLNRVPPGEGVAAVRALLQACR